MHLPGSSYNSLYHLTWLFNFLGTVFVLCGAWKSELLWEITFQLPWLYNAWGIEWNCCYNLMQLFLSVYNSEVEAQ